jgi:hypothetical protein
VKQSVIVVGLILLLSFIISGGFSVKNSDPLLPSAPPEVATLIGESSNTDNDRALQLRTLLFGSAPPIVPSSPNPSTPPSCSSNIAVDFLLDTSNSMDAVDDQPGLTKMEALRSAMENFRGFLEAHPTTPIGIQIFSSTEYDADNPGINGSNLPLCVNNGANHIATPYLPACELLSFGRYNSGSYNAAISKLTHGGGNTYMSDGFRKTQQVINANVNNSEYQGYQWILVFLSDGVPNPHDSQDPILTGVVGQVRPTVGKIITVGLGIEDPRACGNDFATTFCPALMQQISGNPADFYRSRASNLETIFENISGSFCSS